MPALAYGAAVGQAALDSLTAALAGKADKSDIPSPATTAPPMIGDVGVKGTGTNYALEGHTHQSNVQSQRIAVVGTSGIATWAFTTPFDVIPVVIPVAETPSGAAYTNVASVVEGSVTTTSVQIVVQRFVKTITLPSLATSLLGLVLSLFGFAPAGVYVNCIARKPS
ncbi:MULTISPECIES: hypothetical protein [unclassified Rhizobium]|uniref:hypothetical protein n=1 Tax=unclassified Rhizobium TaxID=2613769 RepID=UPI001ADAF444|nr:MULTISPECIES: hypothetical protein [unclassified Rhizobium]MBO9099430.1 hypothetical protein [Rhizobium sp. L58/93]QXZ87084.1 hypothetical protein J5287_21085 [Rhizobium sp. K1/93]QXZ92882.1 hypothetical protein J5280_19810 [Rhizobium sp. K15/93]